MRIISRRALREFWQTHAEAERPLAGWYKVVKSAAWTTFQEVRGTFPSADQVGRLVVFNVSSYRLITRVWYEKGTVFIRKVLTHQEYDRDRWKDDPWF